MEVRQTHFPGRPDLPRGEEGAGSENRFTRPGEERGESAQVAGEEDREALTRIAEDLASAYVAVDVSSRSVVEQIQRAAMGNGTVLIRGESGVGKSFIASLLHDLGPRRNEPVVRIDCARLPQHLHESDIFGSDGTAPRRGRLELAGAGTLILDEIAALSMPLQAKLLRVIEQREFDRSDGRIEVHARIVALTAVDLERAVLRRAIREDLYYRLSVNSLTVPPLRQRADDIQPLAEHFLAQLAQVYRRPKPSFTTDARCALLTFSYPGNLRQLRDIMERVIATCAGPEIHAEDLPEDFRQGRPKMTLEALERGYIAEVLEATRGRKSEAAQILGISRKTLLEKRKRYGLE